ncbi:MAG: flippase [candidate division KSB1 bacterium]|nr:flippase [candidate division KSB1 bacterium]MDZ7341188.1 flippase [candidate division KSB1 bacterium]
MTALAKKIVSNSSMLMGAEIFSRFIRIALVIVSARLLGDENYGKFSFAMAFTTLFLIIADMGIHQLLVREIARNLKQVKKYLANALVIKFFLAALNLLLVFVIINFTNKPTDVIVTVYILAICQIVLSFGELFKSVFQAFQQMKYDAISTLLQSVLDTVLGVGVLWLGASFKELAWVYLLVSVINLGYCLIIVVKKFTPLTLDFDRPLMKFLLREGLPFGILYFFAMMYTYISSVFLSFMVSDEAVGWYNAAYRLVFAMLFIPMGTMKAVFPVLSKYYKDSLPDFKRLFEKTFKVMAFVGISLASLVTLLAKKIILFLYGPEYINAAAVLQILVWSTALIFITTVMTHTTRSSDRQRFTAKAVGFSALLNLGLNYVLISKFSYIGAAYATLGTEASTFILHLFYLWFNLVKPPLVKLVPKIVIINLVMMVYTVLLINANLFLVGITALMVNVAMAWMTHYFSKDEWLLFREVLRFSKS